MLITVRIFGIGPDVFLDERRKRGLRQVLVTVNSGVDKQIDGPGVSPRVVKTLKASMNQCFSLSHLPLLLVRQTEPPALQYPLPRPNVAQPGLEGEKQLPV